MAEPLRLAALRADIEARLRPVCADWPPDLFQQIVESLAAITLKYEGISTAGSYDLRATDALVGRLVEGLEQSAVTRSKGLAQRIGSIPHAPQLRSAPPGGSPGAHKPRPGAA